MNLHFVFLSRNNSYFVCLKQRPPILKSVVKITLAQPTYTSLPNPNSDTPICVQKVNKHDPILCELWSNFDRLGDVILFCDLLNY